MRLYILRVGDSILATSPDKAIIRARFFSTIGSLEMWIMTTDDETGDVMSYTQFLGRM
jgi:hypothetical protein